MWVNRRTVYLCNSFSPLCFYMQPPTSCNWIIFSNLLKSNLALKLMYCRSEGKFPKWVPTYSFPYIHIYTFMCGHCCCVPCVQTVGVISNSSCSAWGRWYSSEKPRPNSYRPSSVNSLNTLNHTKSCTFLSTFSHECSIRVMVLPIF